MQCFDSILLLQMCYGHNAAMAVTNGKLFHVCLFCLISVAMGKQTLKKDFPENLYTGWTGLTKTKLGPKTH